MATTHRSACIKPDNERLELLGDAVLDLIAADYLYRCFPQMDEGRLTKLKAKLISRVQLRRIAELDGLVREIEITKQHDLDARLIIGNVLEAIFGAIYLDQGYNISRDRAVLMFDRHCDLNELIDDLEDPKSQLLEWSQREKNPLRFQLEERSEGRFEAHVFVGDEHIASGGGRSKKKAEKVAAKQALMTLKLG